MLNRELDERENFPARGWERWGEVLGDWLPYGTLAFTAIYSLVQPGQDWFEYLLTALLVALAAGWVYGMFTRAPREKTSQPKRMGLYFVGFLALSSILMLRQPFFFVFALTGFFHASYLKHWPLTLGGIAATAILVNTVPTGFPWPEMGSWFYFGTLIVIQTLAIGFGTLISGKVAQLSEQRRQMVARLEAALEENAGLHAQLLAQAREAGVLEERQRLAREIHDTLAQGLIGIITQMEAAQQTRERPSDAQRHLENAMRLARENLTEARRSVNALRPEPLENARLPDALAEVSQQWSGLNNVPVEVKTCGTPIPLHPEIEAALLRTAQEALANIAKHAGATRANVTLSYMGDEVTLDVRDNGVGFAKPAGQPSGSPTEPGIRGNGFGLVTMRERVNRVAGSLEIESEPGGGTAVSARVPAIPASGEDG